jgi:hypothetical protein
MLLDRVCVMEGRLQVYGTSFDWDDHGIMNPSPMQNPESVDERRASVGLPPLAAAIAKHQAEAVNEPKPDDLLERRREFDEWARRVGWR